MQRERKFFDEKTLLSTPDPIFSSSLSQDDQALQSVNSSVENSLELNKQEGSGNMPFNTGQKLLDEERQKAYDALKKANDFQSLPSRFLRRSEISEGSSLDFHSESTISECDLILTNSSTPRQSLLDNLEAARRCPSSNRQSLASNAVTSLCKAEDPWSTGQKLSSLASTINTDASFNMSEVINRVRTSMEPQSSFKSGQEALAKLEQDELSWRRAKVVPTRDTDFSFDSEEVVERSMGDFFKQKSDNLSNILAKSPDKQHEPFPLLDSTVSSIGSNVSLKSADKPAREEIDSLSVSRIAEILQDQTAGKALDCFLNTKKNCSGTKSPVSAAEMDEEKENVDVSNIRQSLSPEIPHHKSLSLSVRSASSLSSLPNGKLPIATTKTEMIWGCIRVGKSVSQEFVLRNRADSRVGLKCAVKNSSFRLSKEGLDLNFLSEFKLYLYPFESRSLIVTFTPTTIGAVVDELSFTSIDPKHKQTVNQFIRLYGYGGHGTVSIHKIIKDTAGKFLLNLGNIDNQERLKQVFVVKNRGTLASFVCCNFVPNGLYSFSAVQVFPKSVVLLPGEEKQIGVVYVPQKKDKNYMKSKLNCAVVDMGKVQIVSGTEVDRGRLRRLCLKAKAKGQEIKQSCYEITERIEGEAMPSDLRHLRESFSSAEEILKCLNNEEITVTVEQDVDYTITEQLPDETAMFHSLCEDPYSDTFNRTASKESCSVEPNRIILTPPDKNKDMIFLTNNRNNTMYFEVSSTPEGLHLRPRNGTIANKETLVIEVYYTERCKSNNPASVHTVRIMVDNESYDVNVKIMFRNRMKL